jgi:deoxyribonuclease (pyrimidine dimer)|tara:strand:- start:398 stop:799 length:402 start_codon:yes stop_codon:yes gene_type:complete
MTRINIVPVHELCNQHLFAEWREMPRLVGNLEKSLSRKLPFKDTEISPEYVLGKGHVKFFYDKFEFLYKRHKKLTEVLIDKGYDIRGDSDIFKTVNKKWFNDWNPSVEEMDLNRKRIMDRMPKNAKWKNVGRV